jgi:hypothetical protein
MPTLTQPTPFVDDVGAFLAGPDLELFRLNAMTLDGWSFRRQATFDSSSSATTSYSAILHTGNDFQPGRYTLRYFVTMTTLTIEGQAASYGASTLRVYVDGMDKGTVTMGATWTKTISIATGYTSGQFIDVQINVEGNPSETSVYVIDAVYGTPITAPTSWPGAPAWGSAIYSATRCNQFVAACQNLYDRMNLIPIVAQVAHVFVPVTHKAETHRIYTGSVLRSFTADKLRVFGNAVINNTAEVFRVYVGGALAYTSPTMTVGTYSILQDITLTHTVGTRANVAIEVTVTDATNQDPNNTHSSRYTFTAIRAQATGTGYPYATPPAAFVGNGSINDVPLDAALSTLSSMLTTVNARLNGASTLWGRAYAMRKRYALDEHQNTKLMRIYPHVMQRLGDRLVVRGKGVKIAWGAITVESQEDGIDYSKYTWSNEQEIIGGDSVDTATVFLDSLPGLYPSTQYFVFGSDVQWVGEYLS